nr:predicted GPI-anchored protein 58 isoform X1 [Aegilops tauschii subsp. strangulata]
MFSPRRHLPTSPILQPPDLFQSPPAAAHPVHPSSRHPRAEEATPTCPVLRRELLSPLATSHSPPSATSPVGSCRHPSSPSPSRAPPGVVRTITKHPRQCHPPPGALPRFPWLHRPQAAVGSIQYLQASTSPSSESQNAHAETSNATKQSSPEQSVQLYEVTKQVKNNQISPSEHRHRTLLVQHNHKILVRGFRKGVHCMSQEQLQMNNLQMNKYYR